VPVDPAIVVINPDEDCSPEAFRAFIDELLAGPEPELETLDGAEAVRALRTEAEG
jgi:hypothetical protein